MRRRTRIFGTCFGLGIVTSAMVFGSAQRGLALNSAATSGGSSDPAAAPAVISEEQSAHRAGVYSAGIGELMRLLEAKMDSQVLLTYIQNAPIPYSPSASELVMLKEHGASPEVLVALLHRGNEVRMQLAQTQRAANAPRAASGYGYTQEGASQGYPYDYSDYSYAGYPTTYYNYGYGWPSAYRPPLPLNLRRPVLYPYGRFPAQRVGGPILGAYRARPGGGAPGFSGPRVASAPVGGRPGFSAPHPGGVRGPGPGAGPGRGGGHGGGGRR